MSAIVQYTDWLEEEVGNMARDGLRTLVVAKKILTEEQYQDFEVNFNKIFNSEYLALLCTFFSRSLFSIN